jgi:hypothetical protein
METDEMRDGKIDRAAGIKAQSGDRREERSGDRQEGTIGRSKDRMVIEMAIGWGYGVVCHSVGLRSDGDRVNGSNGDRIGIDRRIEMVKLEWFATQWVFMQPARMRASWKMGHHAACFIIG